MRRWRSRFGALAAAALLSASWGCGGGAPPVDSSTEEATVKGIVKVKGKPITDGEVIFNPTNYKRAETGARRAKIQPDGHYEVTTLVGQNSITLAGPAVRKNPQLAYGALTYEVHSGADNEFNIELPPAK